MKFAIFVFALLMDLFFGNVSFAETIIFPPGAVQIKESIQYSVVGRYQCTIEKSSGYLVLDDQTHEPQAVYLQLQVDSIRSKHPSLDNIVRSAQLLDVKKYPYIIFKSQTIQKKENDYYVVGELTMHGVTQELASPFTFKKDEAGRLELSGEWIINRKDFGITWNKFLDHGGVLVGNHITVEWDINLSRGDKK